jgi:tetratricopeptide (TPR) repeat protein
MIADDIVAWQSLFFQRPMRSTTNQPFFSKPFLWPTFVFLVALSLYVWTLAPTVTLVDSGELIVAAHSLGVAHPPGFPLYLMLAHLASIVPIGSVAQRVNFASAVFAVFACVFLTLVVMELLNMREIVGAFAQSRKKRKGKRSQQPGPARDDHRQLTIAAAGIAGGLLFACSRTLWTYATIAEVYTLNSLLILLIFFLMLRWRRWALEARGFMTRDTAPGTENDQLLLGAAILFGLALGVHHVSVALTLPALAVIVYRTAGAKFFFGKRLLFAALFALVALLLVYSYLPIAAARDPILNWGDPRSLSAIWSHITGWQYRVFLTFSPANVVNQFPQFGRFLLREFGVPWLPLTLCFAAIGFVTAFKRDRTTFFFLLLIVLADVGYCLNYEIAEDKDAYYLPTFIAFAIAAALGIHWALQFFSKRFSRGGACLMAVPVALLLPAIALASNGPYNNRRHYFIAHDYVDNILSSIEPNGLLLTVDWQVASPMLYAREIEQHRRDAKIVDVNLLRRSWYFDYLKRAYPELVERSRDKIDSFVAELKRWERDPDAYTMDSALTQRIGAKFEAMLESIVANELNVAPAYVTSELIVKTEGADAGFTNWLNRNYQAVPRGLVFQLVTGSDFHDPGPLRLQTRGLADGTIRFEPDDVVTQKVLPIYKSMLVNRGRYLAHFGDHQHAIEAFTQALALDPHLNLALEGLQQSRAQLGTGSPR